FIVGKVKDEIARLNDTHVAVNIRSVLRSLWRPQCSAELVLALLPVLSSLDDSLFNPDPRRSDYFVSLVVNVGRLRIIARILAPFLLYPPLIEFFRNQCPIS